MRRPQPQRKRPFWMRKAARKGRLPLRPRLAGASAGAANDKDGGCPQARPLKPQPRSKM